MKIFLLDPINITLLYELLIVTASLALKVLVIHMGEIGLYQLCLVIMVIWTQRKLVLTYNISNTPDGLAKKGKGKKKRARTADSDDEDDFEEPPPKRKSKSDPKRRRRATEADDSEIEGIYTVYIVYVYM